MLPHVDSTVLTSNPSFARLHRDLIANKLENDGSSRIQDAQELKQRKAFVANLHNARLDLERKSIINNALREIAGSNDLVLPDELRDVIQIVLAKLDGRLDGIDLYLADVATSSFLSNLDQIIPLLAEHLAQTTQLLTHIASTASPPLSSGRPPRAHDAGLLSSINELESSVSSSKRELHTSRVALGDEASRLISLFQQLNETIIKILERSVHGSVARATRARAEKLAAEAETLRLEVRVREAVALDKIGREFGDDASIRQKTREIEKGNAELRMKIAAF